MLLPLFLSLSREQHISSIHKKKKQATIDPLSQTIIHVSTAITKIHNVKCTKHAHCRVYSIQDLAADKGIYTYHAELSACSSKQIIKMFLFCFFKKSPYFFFFLHFTNSSSEIKTIFCVFSRSFQHETIKVDLLCSSSFSGKYALLHWRMQFQVSVSAYMQ